MSHSTMYNEISGQAGKTMNLSGPFPLTMESIEREIQGRSPGNYSLGSVEGKDWKCPVCQVPHYGEPHKLIRSNHCKNLL